MEKPSLRTLCLVKNFKSNKNTSIFAVLFPPRSPRNVVRDMQDFQKIPRIKLTLKNRDHLWIPFH